MLVFTKQQNKLTLSLLIQYCQVSDLIPSEARRFRKVYNLVAREAGWPRAVLAACKLGWPIYIYIFEYVYRSFPVGIRIQCDVSQYMHFRFMVVCERNFLDYRWITIKFLQCQWPTKASTTNQEANPRRGELLWSNNRTPNWNLARATKKTTTAKNPATERTSL